MSRRMWLYRCYSQFEGDRCDVRALESMLGEPCSSVQVCQVYRCVIVVVPHRRCYSDAFTGSRCDVSTAFVRESDGQSDDGKDYGCWGTAMFVLRQHSEGFVSQLMSYLLPCCCAI